MQSPRCARTYRARITLLDDRQPGAADGHHERVGSRNLRRELVDQGAMPVTSDTVFISFQRSSSIICVAGLAQQIRTLPFSTDTDGFGSYCTSPVVMAHSQL